MRFTQFAVLAIAGALATVAAPAATITYTLNQSACCGSTNFATVTLTDNGTSSVTVTETLASGVTFANTGAGSPLSFSTDKAVTISNVSAPFAAGGANNASPYGDFLYTIVCTSSCPNGGSANGPAGPLTFTVTAVSGTLSISDFVVNGSGFLFASDIFFQGNTGNVSIATTGGGNQTPEPTTMLLTASGMALVGARLVRRRKA